MAPGGLPGDMIEPTSTKAAPAVSVVIPVFNRGDLLARALRSVAAQTFTDWEAIVVDDASSEDLGASLGPLLDDARISLIRQARNAGAAAARNRGIETARGRFIAFLDADDEWRPEKLERQLEAIGRETSGGPVICLTRVEKLFDGGRSIVRPLRPKRPAERFDEFVYVQGSLTQTSSFLVDRHLAREIRFRDLGQYEDHLFFIEAGQRGARYVFVGEPLTLYHAEKSPVRLSANQDLDACERYLGVVRPILSEKALLAFQVRYMARYTMHRHPLAALKLLAYAVSRRAIRPRYVVTFLQHLVGLRSLMPN